VDRQEAAFVVMGVEQRKLLTAVHDIDGVIDVSVTAICAASRPPVAAAWPLLPHAADRLF
jgi:hypothetical protein